MGWPERRFAVARSLCTLLAIVGSSACFALAFPPWRLHALAWVALVPLLATLRRVGPVQGPLLAILWAVVMAWLVGQWMPPAIARYYERSWAFGFAFFVVCATVTAGLYYAAFAAAYRYIVRTSPVVRPPVTAAAWVAIELARGRLLTGSAFFIGNPWALVGYSQVGAGPHVQVAALAGVYGVGFLVALANAALVELWWARGRRDALAPALGWCAVAMGTVAGAWIWGASVERAADVRAAAASAVPIVVVQGNVDVGSQWRDQFYGRNLDVYLGLTAQAVAAGDPRVVFWPEGAMTFHLDREPLYRQRIAQTLAAARVDLVAGGPFAVGSGPELAYRNAVFLVGPDGRVRARYEKQYLVPFAEYFPFAGLDLLRRRFEGVSVFTPGDGRALLPTAAGRAGVVVCNEAMLPEVVAMRVEQGAQYLFNPANDGWLDDGTYSALLLDIVLLRTIEQRRWLVRASTSGPSAVIDPFGRVQAASAPLAQALLAGHLVARDERTLYGRLGDLFAVGAAALAILGVVVGWRSTTR
jgi:apolipoprotein N-acyltransferase